MIQKFFRQHRVPVGFALALLFIATNTAVSFRSLNLVIANSARVSHIHEVIAEQQQLFSAVQDLETGQRGYVITGRNSFLKPYQRALREIPRHLQTLETMTRDPKARKLLPPMRALIQKRMEIAKEVVRRRQRGDFEGARRLVITGRGKHEMDRIRAVASQFEIEELNFLHGRDREFAESSLNSRLTLALAALANIALLGLVYYMIQRELAERRRVEERMNERTRLAMLSAEVGLLLTRDQPLQTILERCAQAIVRHLQVNAARLWLQEDDGATPEIGALAGAQDENVSSAVAAGRTKVSRILADRRPYLTNHVIGNSQIGEQEWLRREGMTAFAGYPMLIGERALGVLTVFSRRPLGEHALRALGTVADALALGIQRRQTEAELARSEARKSSIVQTSLDCIITMDHTHRIHEWNPAAEKTFGYSREEAIGQILPDLIIPEEYRAAHRAGVERYLETGETVILNRRIEVSALRRDGEEFPVELSVTRIEGEGAPLFTAYVRDITARKKAELDLQRARDSAENANKTKSLFLANMSHELRTPLNAILGYSEMLREEADGDGQTEFALDLEKINSAGKHLLTLINDILDLSKIEAGKMELYLEEFDVADVVRELATTITPLLEKNHNTLRLELKDETGEMCADLTKVRQCVLNLLSNAAKFTREGEITVQARRERMDERDWIVISVQDTGIGLSREQLVKLFRPFTQADSSTTRKFGGTGLGLALTRRFCQMMGGDVTVASTPDVGSVFTLKIPAVVESVGDVRENDDEKDDFLEIALQELEGLAAESTPDADTASAAAEGAPGETASARENDLSLTAGAGRLVLVIDDDEMQCELMRRFLESEGFSVVLARSGEEGLVLARQLHPCAITLDVMMPDMDGWAVLSELKNDATLQDTPVIMLTMVDDKNQGYALGASEYLTKPVSRRRLTQLLEKYHCPESPCSVLVVEDDLAMRAMLCKMLANAGWQTHEASDGVAALQNIERHVPNLILLDLMMPEMDGFQFSAMLRRHDRWREIPVIVLTAKELTAEDRLRLNGYVQKVLQKNTHTREELMQQVRDLIVGSTPENPPDPT